MSKVAVYCRVSTESQEAEGTSLDTQERACLIKARELDPAGEVTVLREVYSGLTLDRPELGKLREWVRQGQVKAVVVYAADRLARDGLHLLLLVEEIEKAGAVVAFVTELHQVHAGRPASYLRPRLGQQARSLEDKRAHRPGAKGTLSAWAAAHWR